MVFLDHLSCCLQESNQAFRLTAQQFCALGELLWLSSPASAAVAGKLGRYYSLLVSIFPLCADSLTMGNGGGSVPLWERAGARQTISKRGSLGKRYAGHYSIQPRRPQRKNVLGLGWGREVSCNKLHWLHGSSGKTLAPFNTKLCYTEGPFPDMLSQLRSEEAGDGARLVECSPSIHQTLSLNPSIA